MSYTRIQNHGLWTLVLSFVLPNSYVVTGLQLITFVECVNENIIWRLTDFVNEAIWFPRKSLDLGLTYSMFKYQHFHLIICLMQQLFSLRLIFHVS